MIVTGHEGEGKSTLLRQIAIQCAAGVHPFTFEKIEKPVVLLLDLENSREQIKSEILKICTRAGVRVPRFAVHPLPSGINLAIPEQEAALRLVIQVLKPDLVIGGPLYKLVEASLSDEAASRLLAAALDRLRVEFGFALVLEAHQVNETIAFDPKTGAFRKNRPQRPFGSSLWRRWPEFGVCLFTDGTLVHWRGQRQEREFPAKLQRDGDVWLWQAAPKNCAKCGEPVPEGKEMYCSDKCRAAAKKSRQRARQ